MPHRSLPRYNSPCPSEPKAAPEAAFCLDQSHRILEPMHPRLIKSLALLLVALTSGTLGYTARESTVPTAISIPAITTDAPKAGSTRILYSLDTKQIDQEIIALINEADDHIYFAIYTFTLSNVADALVEAKKRGVDVRGLVDAGQASTSYSKPIMAKLLAAGIPVATEKHETGNGIMHIKALVTENAYVMGSFNWTSSATNINDEIVEIGTDPNLVAAYRNILERLLAKYKGTPAAAGAAANISSGTFSIADAASHVGEYASVRGVLVESYTSASGTTFLDFCANYKTCPFTAVIFADDTSKFGDLSRYQGKTITLTGKISLYQGKAEIVLKNPSQIAESQ